MLERPVTGVEVDNVTMTNSPSSISVNFTDAPRFASEWERKDWQSRQIAALRNALIGDDQFGVTGLVVTVRNQRIWLILLTVAVVAILLLLLRQQVQIGQILHEISILTRIP